ncbi:hypothetical protein [Hwangdonia lutea]|uniref:Seryl-tRNA synthetase n=1 Tax=Hwangdonia lutea TaxID=3075823 RepID=A0AA97HSR6_9FLAO|nr:hypothetical protein [Hwangdonia sp. SCSIO 19198]WOD45163.1 hypothetical protein RNZ46_07805 [Hwangdonia sp. SCSIO 19198]
MKKNILCLMLVALSLGMCPNTVMAADKNPKNITAKTHEMPPEVKVMIDRINEIKNMDKSSLTRMQRKELRKEVRSMKKSVRASGNGIYISSGAIIIILLLIIIL